MTSVRDIECEINDGCRILTDKTLDYSDGAEQRVFDILAARKGPVVHQ